ncbi:IS21-like element ISMac9 family helper ATPase IstB [Methanosarcina acetivorans]|uniref:IstB helper protein n=2 Tax=Methanosarcina acetivorans TaxID=2214 RepID=Q8TH54_METAC|nr:IS21-like element ISMac9 family helper ATPase IstB [Methanosarcina acetivorans]AAM05480.1 IstB helper protein [Methanosarcina acetivorans C2A]AAM05597.1 IstB helper protein [Methanosarcina acetivorans C2A]AAM06117.1 IstB helper protein [Methanosarcina acetivorans C2A]AAM06696.1 IstB helper protein [Methanosarcina acetivorans C2A]
MNNFSYERLHSNLQYLKLNTIEEVLDNYLEIAARDSKTTMEVLDYLFEQEKKHREAAAIERRMKSAAFPVKKTLDEFDFEFQSSIDKKVIEDLATLRFVHNVENVVFLGPPGVGKSHLAIALGIEVAKAGISVYFTNTGNLIEKLKIANREGMLEKKLKGFMKFKVLIIDEMGYLPFDEEGAHCLFQLISRRYEKSSTIFTSNKSYGEWGEIFKDQVIAAAVLDRILHHCTTINIRGESYRLKERKKHGIKSGNIYQ